MSGHAESVASPITCYQYARQCWEREHWGLPRDNAEARLWTLFFSGREPIEPWTPHSWNRPAGWVEMLIRFGPPPAVSAVTQHEQADA